LLAVLLSGAILAFGVSPTTATKFHPPSLSTNVPGVGEESQSKKYTLVWKNQSSETVGGYLWSKATKVGPNFDDCNRDLTGLTDLFNEPCNSGDVRVGRLTNSLSPCEIDGEVSCIFLVETSEDGQSWLPAKYRSEIRPPSYKWKSSVARDLSRAYVGGIYTTAAEKLLMVKAVYSYPSTGNSATSVQVLSVGKKQIYYAGPQPPDYDKEECLRDSILYLPDYTDPVTECLIQIPTKLNIRVTLDLRWEPAGWIHTQIADATAKLEKFGSRTRVTVEGSSVLIPEFTATFKSDVPDDVNVWCELKQTIPWLSHDPLGICGGPAVLDPVLYKQLSLDVDSLGGKQGALDPVGIFNRLVQLRPNASRAISENMTWRFSIEPKANLVSTLGKCFSAGYLGSVGGNPMAIQSIIPTWNSKDSTFNIVIASPHFLSTGDVATGHYELQIRLDVARCLWKVPPSPQSLQISVFDELGVKKNAIATVSVRNGMVIFRATGFSFSIAKFSIGLPPSVKQHIQCKKGRQRLSLRPGVKRCPFGWQRV
jgi:hypothetical protein